LTKSKSIETTASYKSIGQYKPAFIFGCCIFAHRLHRFL